MSDSTFEVRCPFEKCNCVFITTDKGAFVELPAQVVAEWSLLLPKKDYDAKGNFLLVKDIWDFTNAGVTRKVPQTLPSGHKLVIDGVPHVTKKVLKYLTCADCDRGPMGVMCEVAADADEGELSSSQTVCLLSLESCSMVAEVAD
ncbi:HHL174Wp [Eremothecium sinecaudum]|uniref:HHL174Wp n=1 Tax=Eremothecium sinecaudum TaxID=45286 RepID=A0A0X8HW47_9SACH|nr:HHL174Wp [Eremothecium sinecaudum]AMD22596.1 HHL174Wp [Eremothecium sinecaudum]